jgi:hypothetical protein
MKEKEKYAVSVYEYRCRRCQEIFTDTIEKGFGILVGEMIGLNQSDEEIGSKSECLKRRTRMKILNY